MRREITKEEWEYIRKNKLAEIDQKSLKRATEKIQDTFYPAIADLRAGKSLKYVPKKYHWKLETTQMLRDYLLAKGEL
ncbi:hypothetical protein NDK43_25875 [Neobacillus pocheonensis]|uniref:Uncharacterized protein n=1 Tax=Neobacillus pocheonensis TaxID=363869 RepID=A0ABT0WFQ9_9BACI|nr:hypothetical protein [Neobacillus pocheonensis]